MISLQMFEEQLRRTAKRCAEMGILIPTYEQMKNPTLVPENIKKELGEIGLWDVHPRNLFRITWKNQPVKSGGGYGGVNYMVLPPELTGVKAKIIALEGKWFPTGSHKVGATFGCIAPTLITGQFDPTKHKAVWPSTGNFCRGGAYVATLLGCESIAILPEGMSQERFEWLKSVAGETIATPGCESNVKEIFDMCWELRKTREDIMIFNQFDQFGNHLWHYEVTGNAFEEILQKELGEKDNYFGVVLTSGSGGTLGSGDFLKEKYPKSKICVSEALQCPTLLNNGFGGHRIEGIGDKHVPWIHNVKNMDMVVAVDDEYTMRLMRMFNEPAGMELLKSSGVPAELVESLDLMGISSIGNMLSAIKAAKYYELTENDVLFTVFTDSMELYGSRQKQLTEQRGEYSEFDAVRDYEMLMNQGIDNLLEMTYYEKKRIHNLKYYTWIEQQAKELDDLNAQWYDPEFWDRIHALPPKIDELTKRFNELIINI